VDYFGILKRAWEITWKHKVLWVLGFFAMSGGGSSGGGGGSSYQFDAENGFQGMPYANELRQVADWFEANAALLIVIAAVAALFGIVYFILSIAARGGLVHSVNEVEQGRPVALRDSWGVGFHHWGRTFMVGLVAFLPLIVIAVALVATLVPVFLVTSASTGAISGTDSFGPEGLAAAGGTVLCCVLPLFVLLIAVLGVILSIVMELAIRYGVLYDMTFGKALAQGWKDVRAKRGAVVMWLVMLLPAIAYGIVVGGILLGALIPAVLVLRDGSFAPAIILAGVVMLVLLVPGAIYGTFVSAAWTVFFRRMTGLGQPAVQPAPGYPSSGTYPPPPVAYPPAPPASPEWAPPAPPAFPPPPAPPWEGPIVPEQPTPPESDA
jgi:hypothetical protein